MCHRTAVISCIFKASAHSTLTDYINKFANDEKLYYLCGLKNA